MLWKKQTRCISGREFKGEEISYKLTAGVLNHGIPLYLHGVPEVFFCDVDDFYRVFEALALSNELKLVARVHLLIPIYFSNATNLTPPSLLFYEKALPRVRGGAN
jgi:hypothetical protein